ncbi:helix-turn-helix domain-containing protein [Natronorubrum thiooxidans]|uniref:Uncharacterized protein n=1 Tax=Natronorubrum thiooxidans TaxID=308853 RepID=A0A1N7GN83_9EURY|nr:hypothetical protein [Natronorubrum thiooxidans]SIS14020.1 hypothetical protein SAMN05421752_113121 [Natronorubrum thiooxidans]
MTPKAMIPRRLVTRLEAKDLVSHEPYEGATLTSLGRERAEGLHKTDVTLSWFFRAVLALDAHERKAMRMTELVSPSVAGRPSVFS